MRQNSMQTHEEQVIAGQAVYTQRMLRAYDVLVLGISNRFIWKCPMPRILSLYQKQVSANHLDVGVGTGYFLDRCPFPTNSPRIALMDMNHNTLEFAAERIARYQPEQYQQNILKKIETRIEPFDSVGVNYLLHCVPGAISEKAVLFDHLQDVMNPGARLFGSTILQSGVPRSWSAKRLMSFYNEKGIFGNSNDDLQDLENALTSRFENVKLEVVGCVALFSGQTAATGDDEID